MSMESPPPSSDSLTRPHNAARALGQREDRERRFLRSFPILLGGQAAAGLGVLLYWYGIDQSGSLFWGVALLVGLLAQFSLIGVVRTGRSSASRTGWYLTCAVFAGAVWAVPPVTLWVTVPSGAAVVALTATAVALLSVAGTLAWVPVFSYAFSAALLLGGPVFGWLTPVQSGGFTGALGPADAVFAMGVLGLLLTRAQARLAGEHLSTTLERDEQASVITRLLEEIEALRRSGTNRSD